MHKEYNEYRLGKFTIPNRFISGDLDNLMKNFFSRIFIVKAEYLYAEAAIEYVGYSDFFEPIRMGERPPEYDIVFSKQHDGSILVGVQKK